MDVSYAMAKQLGFVKKGVGRWWNISAKLIRNTATVLHPLNMPPQQR